MQTPAFANLNTKQLTWKKINNNIIHNYSLISQKYPFFDLEGAYSSANESNPKYLRLIFKGNNKPFYFAKIIKQQKIKHEEALHCISIHLQKCAISTQELIDSFNINTNEKIFIYKWLPGSPPCLKTDFKSLGIELAKLHRGLSSVGKTYYIQKKTDVRLKALYKIAANINFENSQLCEAEQSFVKRVAKYFIESNDFITEIRAPCHGDLNIGNILVQRNSKFAFIDLEDSIHSSVWPGFDIAKIIERLILPQAHKLTSVELKDKIVSLIHNYKSSKGTNLGPDFDLGKGFLAKAMRWHLGLSVLILIAQNDVSTNIWQQEISKFMKIELLVNKYEYLL